MKISEMKLFNGFLNLRNNGQLINPENLEYVIKEMTIQKINVYTDKCCCYAEIFCNELEPQFFITDVTTVEQQINKLKNATPKYQNKMNVKGMPALYNEWYEEEYIEYFGIAKDAETVKQMMIKELHQNMKNRHDKLKQQFLNLQNELNKIQRLENFVS